MQEEYNDTATVTLSLDDGTEEECLVLTVYEAAGRQYVALLPLSETGEEDCGEVYLYRFDDSGEEPELDNIVDDAEYEAASAGFEEWLDSQEYDELIYEEEDGDLSEET